MLYQVKSTIMELLFGVLPSLNHKKPECDKKRTSHLVVADGDMTLNRFVIGHGAWRL